MFNCLFDIQTCLILTTKSRFGQKMKFSIFGKIGFLQNEIFKRGVLGEEFFFERKVLKKSKLTISAFHRTFNQ